MASNPFGTRFSVAALAALLVGAVSAFAWPPSAHEEGTPIAAPSLGAGAADGSGMRIVAATSLHDAVERVAACGDGCAGVFYFWSERMPLSLRGVEEIRRAATALGVELTLLETESVEAEAHAVASWDVDRVAIADALLGSGALAHAPALVSHAGRRVVGPAILGYKREETYARMIRRRLDGGVVSDEVGPNAAREGNAAERGRLRTDYRAVGTPGAYFRSVPGRQSLAYESGRRVWLLDLADGENREAPGFIDFVPTPDGRYFVTPAPRDGGLELYDADAVFDAAPRGRASEIDPLFVDARMRDQYPSVGVLEGDDERTVYRVLTSWFEGVVYRDYEVEHRTGNAPARVRPLSDTVTPCRGMSLSIPILSPDGLELAARDEANGTTKILRIGPRGGCSEVAEVGVHTTKVAWHPSGRLLAFARPRLRTAGTGWSPTTVGLFLFDRESPGRVTRIRGTDGASALAFPDFIGDDALVFLVPGTGEGTSSTFRVIEGIR